MAGRAADPILLKAAFRELDTNRNGTIDQHEMAVLLRRGKKDMSDKTIEMVFKSIDVDGSGEITFDEFVDFIYSSSNDGFGLLSKKSGVLKKVGKKTVASIHQMNAMKRSKESRSIELFGSKVAGNLNGVYEMESGDWLICASAGADKYKNSHVNGNTLYRCRDLGKYLFFGNNGGREGWFVAGERPKGDGNVTTFDAFNPSKFAKKPTDCCAPWETRDGRFDMRLCCEEVVANKEDQERVLYSSTDNGCLESELWECSDEEDDSDSDSDDDDLNWRTQANEAHCCASSSDSDSEDKAKQHNRLSRCTTEPIFYDKASKQGVSAQLNESKTQNFDSQVRGQACTGDLADAGKHKIQAAPKRKSADPVEHKGTRLKMAPGFQVNGPSTKNKKSYDVDDVSFTSASRSKNKSSKRGPRGDTSSQLAHDGRQLSANDVADELAKFEDGFFVDKTFPPLASSLGDTPTKVDGWARLSKLHEKACLFHRVDADDVTFSPQAGDVWFLIACAAVAEYPAWIHAAFGKDQGLTKNCKYKIRLFHPGKGEFVWVTVDDYVPTYKGSPAFAGISGDGEAWAALVEKAFAKLCGSFAATEHGETCFGMHYICGGAGAEAWTRIKPVKPGDGTWRRALGTFREAGVAKEGFCQFKDRGSSEELLADGRTRDDDFFWKLMRRFMERCFPVVAEVDPLRIKGTGLESDRLYSILGTRVLPAGEDYELRMVFLRDPFGIGDWKGRWSGHCSAWDEHDTALELLRFNPYECNGTFWMAYTDFLRIFQRIHVCKKSLPVQGCNEHKHVGLKRGLQMTNA
eukprot:TRINITY_DN17098_c0_g1_i1.p1 TRINITY_DN17098_c0_g1~~TRINITY_DN17098_c0_g1_i1.p1  ORF type:complete len:803 (-),score=120.12 TRINITY_DN17098_c0_g1_i1:20-2428(-)